jgi:hypothetical protein
MTDTIIRCPECGAEIAISEVLGRQIRSDMEAQLRQQLQREVEQAARQAEQRVREASELELRDLRAQIAERARQTDEARQRELALRARTRELEAASQEMEQRLRGQLRSEFEAEARAKLETAVQAERTRAVAERAAELETLQQQLAVQKAKAAEAQAAELKLRQQQEALEQRSRELDLEIARRLDDEKRRIETSVREHAAQEQALKIKEKEKQIADLRQALEDAKRRSELGSQELQGEVLELDIQAELERRFPHDVIEPVLKGARGADILQRVVDSRGQACGSIVWETKNTKHWQPAWLDKLKQDQRASGGNLAVLVSAALPDEVRGFARIEGVWVCDLASWPALALVLREQLIEIAFAHAASEGKQEKMELLYRYLAGDQFRARVAGIVEAFTALQEQVQRERRAMEKQWREREKQIERVMLNTTGLYGEMRGIVGAGIPSIAALELDDEAPPELEDHNRPGG